jgi:hypothetical protein
MKAMAKVVSEASIAAVASVAVKNQLRKDDHGGSGVDVEVEEFDGRADETGKKHLYRRIPMNLFSLRTFLGGGDGSGCILSIVLCLSLGG